MSRHPSAKKRVSACIFAILSGTLAVSASADVSDAVSFDYAETDAPKDLMMSKRDKANAKSVSQANERSGMRVIVQFDGDSIAQKVAASQKGPVNKSRGNILGAAKSTVSTLEKQAAAQRAQFARSLKSEMAGAEVIREYSTVFNGVAVSIKSQDDLAKLLQMKGVKAVFPEEMVTVDMDASVSLIEATKVWQALGGHDNAGKGVRVAIVDSGIRPESEMFHDAGMLAPTNLPTDDYCRTANPSFCNNKLIVARFSQPTFPVYQSVDGSGNPIGEYMSPLGYSGHGTHVAGTVAGRQISVSYKGVDTTISGVAPGAYLMMYKALFATPANPASSSGSNIMLLEALDWAVRDGADVINNSWGGSAGAHPDTSPYKAAFEAAEAAGVVIASSAGNSGPGVQTVGCPGCIESGITVANTTTGRVFANGVSLSGTNYVSLQSSTNLLTTDINAPISAAISVNVANEQGCSAWPSGTFTGKVALISRGTCSFDIKANNASGAGAIGVVIYNNSAAAPIVMSMPTATVPGVMVSQQAGQSMIAALTANPSAEVAISATVTRQIDAQYADNMASSSSRGPNGDSSILKPDLAAPGSNILSAVSPDTSAGALFAEFTGTSMASPHVAGAAAVVLGMRPTLSPREVKTLLTSTTVTEGLKKETVSTNADAFDVGAGRLNVDAATKGMLTFDKASNVNNFCAINCTFRRTVKNHSSGATNWNVSVSFTDTRITGSSPTSALAIAAGADASFDVSVNTSYAPPNAWYFGRVTLTDASGVLPTQHMPIVVFGHNADDSSVLSIGSTSSNVQHGNNFNVTTTLNNATFNNTIQLQVPMAADTSYVPNSVASVVTNGTQNGLSYDAGANRLVWVGSLAPASISLSGSATTIEDISPTGNNSGVKATCSATCDDTSFSSNLTSVGGFLYNGQVHTTLQYSSNGVAFAGTQSGASTGFNQQLPSTVAPNNALAPFWTDLDLLGTAVGDAGAGNIYNKTAVEGDGFTYRTIQWDKVALYGDTSGNLYTFQLKIRLGGTSESIRFNYLTIPNMPAAVTVGAEDAAGKIGVSRYFNGTGSSVSNGQSLLVNTVVGGKVVLTHNAKSSALNLGSNRTVTLDEDTSANVNVLAMLNPSELKLLKAKVLHQATGAELNAVNTLAVGPNGSVNPASITLTTAPAHGVAVVATDGTLAYTPNANYAGSDNAVVTFKDAAANDVARMDLTFNVVGVNEAPTVSAGADKMATGNAVVTLTGTASDVDGDTLSYQWTQVSGTTVNMINANTTEMRFSAPNKTESSVFRLTAMDAGGLSASDEVSVAVTALATAPTPPSSSGGGGSFAWFGLALALIMTGRRLSTR